MYSAPTVDRKTKGRWRARTCYENPDGERRFKTKALKAQTKADAQKEANTWVAALEREAAQAVKEGKRAAAGGKTVAEYLEATIKARAASVDPSTLSGYRTILKNRVRRYKFGGLPMAQVAAADCEEWVAALVADGLAPVTVKKAFVVVKGAFKQAHERGEIRRDPFATVKAPKIPRDRPNALDAEGRSVVAGFCRLQPGDRYSCAYLLAMMCGLRRGEVCGLQWRDVDLGTGCMSVARSIGHADAGDIGGREKYGWAGFYVKEPKTAQSARVVALPKAVCEALRARRAAMQEECLREGYRFTGNLYVLGSPDGTGVNPRHLLRRWSQTVAALGLVGTEGHPPTFHDLRHTYATAAIAAGVDVKTVSVQMGHANAAITLNTYASPDPDAARRAAEIMDAAIRPKDLGQVVEFAPTGTE